MNNDYKERKDHAIQYIVDHNNQRITLDMWVLSES